MRKISGFLFFIGFRVLLFYSNLPVLNYGFGFAFILLVIAVVAVLFLQDMRSLENQSD
jgi:hypothetical protein